MAAKGINSVKDLKGKRIAVSRLAMHLTTTRSRCLAKSGLKPRDVQWVPSGTDANSRCMFLTTGRADATLLTAPAYFKVEEQGYKNLGESCGLQRHLRVERVSVHEERRSPQIRKLPELIIKAQAEAIKRFYEDKAFAVKAYIVM